MPQDMTNITVEYLDTHAVSILREIAAHSKSLIITRNGEATAVIQDIQSYEQTQESIAMLMILAQSSQDLREGKFASAKEVFADLKKRIQADK